MTALSEARKRVQRRRADDVRGFRAGRPATREETFREFVARVRPGYRWYRHCEALAAVLQRVADGELRRVMVFEPPRHGKSEEVSRLFAAYYLHRHPERWVGINSYAAELAYTLSRAARENYQRAGGTIRGDAAAVRHWETPAGGGLWAAGVGGPITGKGYHLGVIDDPLKNAQDAASQVIRERQKDWYRSTFSTREEPGGAVIVIQTRWHEDDLSGWLLACERAEDEEPEGWHIVCLPAVAEESRPEFPATCTVEPDWREPGEPLCEERYPLEKLRKLAKRLGSYFWGALFQQRPAPEEGRIFQRDWFRNRYRDLPEFTEVYSAWDLAVKDGAANDETACVVMGLASNGNRYVLRVTHGRWETPDVARYLQAQADWLRGLYGERYRGDYVEDKAAGPTLIQYVRRSRPDLALIPVPVSAGESKETRARGVTPICEAGTVLFPDTSIFPEAGAWVDDTITQLLGFPGAARDDIADSFVHALRRAIGTIGKRERGKRRPRRGGYV